MLNDFVLPKIWVTIAIMYKIKEIEWNIDHAYSHAVQTAAIIQQ